MKRIIALLLALALVLCCLAGCGEKRGGEDPAGYSSETDKEPEKEAEKEPEPEGNLRRTTGNKETNSFKVMSSAMTTLDPMFYKAAHEGNAANLLYDTLYTQDASGAWIPWLATAMEPSEDNTLVEVTLRDDVYFHSGDRMTAEDVAYSLAHCANSTFGSDLAMGSMIEVVDETHLKWYFPVEKYDFSAFREKVYRMPVINKSFYEEKFGDPAQDFGFEVDGTGPYVISSFEQGSQNIVFTKNSDYWGDRGYFDTITMVYGAGNAQMAFEAGEIDYAGYTGSTAANAEAYDNVKVETRYSDSINYLICNTSEGHPTADIKVREALQYAFDRAEAAAISCDDSGVVAWNMLYPTVQYYSDILPHRTLDEAKAKALMSEAGYSDSKRCRVTFLTTAAQKFVAAAEVIKENLDKCCFDVTIETTSDYTPYLTGQFDVAILGIALGNSLMNFSALFDPSAGLNLCFYSGEDLEELVTEFVTASDQASADKAVKHMDELFCYVPLSYPAAIYAFDDQLDTSSAFVMGGLDYSRLSWK